MSNKIEPWSRRNVLYGAAALAAGGAALSSSGSALAQAAAAAGRTRTKIKDVQTMVMQGPGRNYVLVKITTDDGATGIGEGYGTPGVAIAEQIQWLKPWLIGKDPFEIDKIYTLLDQGSPNTAGSRTDGSAHGLMRAASAIDMTLWDLCGNMLGMPVSVLMGGQFRDHTRVYDHSGPTNMLDKDSCREWAAKVAAHPSGFTAHKVGLIRTGTIWNGESLLWGRPSRFGPDNGKDPSNRQLTTKEISNIGRGFENMREAIGWDHDIMVHCHWELDLPSSVRLAEAIAPMKPYWLEDPLGVDYNDNWKLLVEKSPVPIHMGENLVRREGFLPFLTNSATNFVNPDLRNSGGFTETKKISDMASAFGIPTTCHNTSSQVHTYQVAQWASAIRDFIMLECITGEGGWMDQVLVLDEPYIQKGYIKVHNRAGTGVKLNRDVVQAHLAPGQKWWGGA